MTFLKRIAGLLPADLQQWLHRRRCLAQIRRGTFGPREPEAEIAASLLRPGDWVLDIGANQGRFTWVFSNLVGPEGRVFAFEPIPETFETLAFSSRHFQHPNVTLFNAAIADRTGAAGMEVPCWEHGARNYYAARLVSNGGPRQVFCMALDALEWPHRIALVKIDVEGHELRVLKGMWQLLERDQPHLIIEASSPEIAASLAPHGYTAQRLEGSPNFLFRRPGA